jgi:hypothetical protein
VEPKITIKPKPKVEIQPKTPPVKSQSKPLFELPKPSFVPEVPQPVLARGVLVTGVVQVDGVIQAIVKAPNERFSRYVLPGQYIANGQVLVKRIDMTQSATPVVVLEEVGIEVFKQVGEKPETTAAQTSPVPTVSNPHSQPGNSDHSGAIPTALLPETSQPLPPPPPPVY